MNDAKNETVQERNERLMSELRKPVNEKDLPANWDKPLYEYQIDGKLVNAFDYGPIESTEARINAV